MSHADFLIRILECRQRDVAAAKQHRSQAALEADFDPAHQPRDLAGALRAARAPAVIAELKKASPSKGLIRADFPVAELARELSAHGAAALSILTEPHYFQGSLENLRLARAATALPLLRKDFIFDSYQLAEARAAGADAVLLIVKMLDPQPFAELLAAARAYQLSVLCEVHDDAELDLALQAGADLIGVNCRDLRTFHTDLTLTERLLRRIPADRTAVAESGLSAHAELLRLGALGASGFLIGETLMRAPRPGVKLKELLCPCY